MSRMTFTGCPAMLGMLEKLESRPFLKIMLEKLEKILLFHMPLLEKLEIYFWSISFV